MNRLTWLFNVLSVIIRLLKPGGVRALAAENLVLRQQLIVINRIRRRAPRLTQMDRFVFGFFTALIQPKRLSKIAIILKPAMLIKFHQALVKQKYHQLSSPKTHQKPGPKGPEQAVIDAILEMKRRNPRFGYRRIAMQIALAFSIEMDKDTVRRVLAKYYKKTPNGSGPSWLTFIGHMKDSLWSVDFFRCESIHLRTHWVMLVMHQFTRRIIGFAVQAGHLDGIGICCLFNRIISKNKPLPKHLSTDNDPLFTSHRWQANLRVFDSEAIKTVPHALISHPFVERLIGTIRREYLNDVLFWHSSDLEKKPTNFSAYYNIDRGHSALAGRTPSEQIDVRRSTIVGLNNYRWQRYCRGLIALPKAA